MSFNKQLRQNKNGSLRNPDLTYDARQNKMTLSATNKAYSPLYYIGNRVSNLGSTFNPDARVNLRFGKTTPVNQDLLYKVYGDYTKYPGVLFPQHKDTTFVNLKPNGKYFESNRIVKMDKYGPYFKFGKNKIYI